MRYSSRKEDNSIRNKIFHQLFKAESLVVSYAIDDEPYLQRAHEEVKRVLILEYMIEVVNS